MYRLVASSFLDKKQIAVAIVGYRTYPDGDVCDQVHDLEHAAKELSRRYPKLCVQTTEVGVSVMGHSSGAHIAFLMMAERCRQQMEETLAEKRGATTTNSDKQSIARHHHSQQMRIDSFIGVSGPYNISHHFDYEASRGLEELSPLKPACGYSRDEFRRNSPALKIVDCLSDWSESESKALDNILPRMVLVHGIEDDVVPFTSTAEAASLLRSCGVTKCEEIYLSKTGHNECVVELMMGGKTQAIILDWLETPATAEESSKLCPKSIIIQSKL